MSFMMDNDANRSAPTFSSSLGFMVAATGSSVGLYNMWKFPYEAGKAGGGGFVVIYLLCVLLLGYPLLVAELALGRYSRENAYKTYAKVGKRGWKPIGAVAIGMAFLLLSFYQVVSGWILGYAYMAASGQLMENCIDFGDFFDDFTQDVSTGIVLLLVINGLAIIIIRQGVRQGIERYTKVFMPLFIIVLLGMICYGLTLDKAMAGVDFFLRPDFSKWSIKLFYTALEQCLSSIGIGIGVMITYGGYLRKRDNLANAGAAIALGDTLVSLLAGLLIFPLLYSEGLQPEGGPPLIFVSLPTAFRSLGGLLGRALGTIYFLLLSLATITSSIAILEMVVKYVTEQFGLVRKQAVNVVMVVLFPLNLFCLFSCGASDFFTHFISYGGRVHSFFDMAIDLFGFLLPVMCWLLSLLVVFRWRMVHFLAEVNDDRVWLRNYLRVMVGYVAPVVICSLIIGKVVL